jgi:hypothetical protein
LQAAATAQDAVLRLLGALKQAVGHEGDERINVNNLADVAAAFCPQAVREVIVPVRGAAGPVVSQPCADAGESVQQLLAETQAYRVVGRLADIEYATEPFRAAEAILQATIYANEANKLKPIGTRAEALERLPQGAAKFGNSLRGVAQTVKAGQPFIAPLAELAQSTQQIMAVTRGLVSNSHFKHERGLLIDAARQMAGDVGRLIEALKSLAREGNPAGIVEEVAASIGGSVSAL